ncbi:hypothetical protein PCASD_15292 [Puccinia coronata f. sp. avenae]|uniref:Yeast cell wall synthesis Kre9/Knh1-like N-terminal domain-containing protein n=1 Tax=Puccinia coronata f. sp. avenae TaxID=200324 RepID=A0A2N5TA02_9BASI|nr:hypothetical protein PCASD_15292 [Puccinia coronata f. sp. avenae]
MALRVTSPSKAASWNLQMPNTITWMSGANDPPTFDIVLVNNNPSCAPTGMSQVIKKQVSCSDGKYSISDIAPVKPCDGYQFYLQEADCDGPAGIWAQSPPFTVAPNPLPAPPPVPLPAPPPVPVTEPTTKAVPVTPPTTKHVTPAPVIAPTSKSGSTHPGPTAQTPAQVVSPNCNTTTPNQPMTDKTPQNGPTAASATSKPSMGPMGTSPLSNFTMSGGMVGGNPDSFALTITVSFSKILSAIAFSAFILCFQ